RQCHGDDDSDSSVDVDIDVVAVGGGDGCRRGGDGYNGGDGGGVVVVVIVTVISVLMSAVVHRDGDGVEVVGGYKEILYYHLNHWQVVGACGVVVYGSVCDLNLAWEPRKRFLPLLRTKIQELAE
ncbi:hypothetical protein S83_028654, partial [Arachis hypogaea]